MKRIFLVMIMLFLTLFVSAQEYIDRDFTFTHSIGVVAINDSSYPIEPKTDKVSLTVVNFGEKGNTVTLKLDVAALKGQNLNTEYSWSGRNVHLVHAIQADGSNYYFVMRGQGTICGIIGKKGDNDQWAAIIRSGDNIQTISDIHVGMSRIAVENVCKGLGHSQFKFSRNSGNLKVYTLYWLDMHRQQHGFGANDYHYEVTNDAAYGDFYFNSQNKLVKWILR